MRGGCGTLSAGSYASPADGVRQSAVNPHVKPAARCRHHSPTRGNNRTAQDAAERLEPGTPDPPNPRAPGPAQDGPRDCKGATTQGSNRADVPLSRQGPAPQAVGRGRGEASGGRAGGPGRRLGPPAGAISHP